MHGKPMRIGGIRRERALRGGALRLFAATALLACQPAAAYAAGAPATGDPSVAIFAAQLFLLMLVGRLLGEAMLRIGQPAVMGQLIAGLVLGPSVLGWLSEENLIGFGDCLCDEYCDMLRLRLREQQTLGPGDQIRLQAQDRFAM